MCAFSNELRKWTGRATSVLQEVCHVKLHNFIGKKCPTNSIEQYRHELAKEELLLAIDSSTEITAQKVCTYLLRQLQSNPDFNIRTGGRKYGPLL